MIPRPGAAAVAAALPLALLAAAVLILPPLGALIGGQPLGQYLTLPLERRAWDPLPPDPGIAAAFLIGAAALVILTLWRARPRQPRAESGHAPTVAARVPVNNRQVLRWAVWGWLAVGAAITAALAGLNGISHPLLLTGLTLLLTAHTERRTGTSLLRQRPGFFLALYPASALIGWLFHWVNLFLQLWVYPGAEKDSVIPFVLVRTLDYSTLVPALLTLRQWLSSWSPLIDWCSRARPAQGPSATATAWLSLTLAGLGLVGAAIWPDWIWPLTWISPPLLILGIQRLRGKATLFSGTRHGDWGRILVPALAALLLGLVIQAWNFLVAPTWTFDLPLIQTGLLFGLPLSAYAGMLPLGPLAIWCADQVAYPWRGRPKTRFPELPIRISVNR